MVKSIIKIKRKIIPVLNRYGVKKAGIFGSFVRGEIKKNSDIDILVEIKKDISLLDFIGMKQEIEDILKLKVDLVEYSTIKPVLKDRILKEEVRLF